ncbi:MAG: ABC transporter permease [Nitrosarchaeum sp.]|nr:ABC transporter permease [Nitrosarchaeum sp.]
MTVEGFEDLYGVSEEYAQVILQTAQGQNPDELVERVKERFSRHRGVDRGEEDFTVETVEDLIATFTNILTGLNSMLILIALISILVASVNIANTMYTATLERTNEIGIMKAVGASNASILGIFLTEAGLLGLIGGALGRHPGLPHRIRRRTCRVRSRLLRTPTRIPLVAHSRLPGPEQPHRRSRRLPSGTPSKQTQARRLPALRVIRSTLPLPRPPCLRSSAQYDLTPHHQHEGFRG